MYVRIVRMPTMIIFCDRKPLKTHLFYRRKSVKMPTLQELLLLTQFWGYDGGIGTKCPKGHSPMISGHKLLNIYFHNSIIYIFFSFLNFFKKSTIPLISEGSNNLVH